MTYGEWWTETRCTAAWPNPHGADRQCTQEAGHKGGHESLYSNTAWAEAVR